MSRLSALTGRPFPFVFEPDGKRFEIEGRYRLAANESNAHLDAVLAGRGFVQMPAFMLRRVGKGERQIGACISAAPNIHNRRGRA